MSRERITSYIVCKKCQNNSWDHPEFEGCSKSICEAEIKGKILTVLRPLRKNE